MKHLFVLSFVALAACVPTDVAVQDRPGGTAVAAAAEPAPKPLPPEIAAPVSTGLPVTATLDCSPGGIGIFGNCNEEATGLCTRAGLSLARLEAIDPENPGVAGLATGFGAIVENDPVPATHRVTCV